MTKQKLLFFLLLLMGMVQRAMAQEPYAVLNDDNTVLTFYYDTQKTARNGMSVGPFEKNTVSWYAQRETITTVVFDDSFAGCTSLTSTAYWFRYCAWITAIIGIKNLKTDNVTSMCSMFKESCSGLTTLDLSGFNTEKVTDMNDMFDDCKSLTSLDVSGFNTSNVTNMGSMFSGCSSLTSLDLSNFDISNVESISHMFIGCSALKTIYANEEKWSTAKVTRGDDVFKHCTSLVGGSGTAYDASHTDHEYARIDKQGQPGYLTQKEATGIEKLSTAPSQGEGAWYTLDGRRVETPTKGINVKNGRKVVVK